MERRRGLRAHRLPWRARKASLYMREFAADTFDRITGRRAPLTPPRRLAWYVGGDFEHTGRLIADLLIRDAGLRPSDHVLDVGCGIGRVAVPLTKYVVDGRYDGFDIVEPGIRWCQREITSRYPNFRFRVVDVRNQRYNPRGGIDPLEFSFPYGDATFDLVFAASLFTHLVRSHAARYLAEMARVLKPGGTAVSTFFGIAKARPRTLRLGQHTYEFVESGGGSFVIDPALPERAVGYRDDAIEELHRHAGLRISAPIRRGSWAGDNDAEFGQDVVIASRPMRS